MVGWLRLNAPVKSQMQTGSAALRSAAIIVSRVGSASAFSRSAWRVAQTRSTATGSSQQVPRSRITGSSLRATVVMLAGPFASVDGLCYRAAIEVRRWFGEDHERSPEGGSGTLRRRRNEAE